jgi:CubicO group peptidase (beta-lactamase class C family)
MDRLYAPCPIAPFYGYLVWLNATRQVFPKAPATSVFAIGAGSSFTWIDPALRSVVIVRWLNADHADTLFGMIAQTIQSLD